MINAKELRNKYFPKDDTALVNAMNEIEKQIIAAAEKKEDYVVVGIPKALKERIKSALEDSYYTVGSAALGRRDDSMGTNTHTYITVMWPEDLVFLDER